MGLPESTVGLKATASDIVVYNARGVWRIQAISPRRSEHSEDRRDEGRPVSIAFNDAQRARQSDVFIQQDKRYVVRGAKGREHIFEPDGELITSFERSHKNHLKKLRQGERRAVTNNEFESFQEIFQ